MLICICGKSGSGKTYISNLFKKLSNNITYLDIDKIGHDSLKDDIVKSNLIKTFGTGILSPDGTVDRKSLGKIVFNSMDEMYKHIDITWPFMEKQIDKFIEANKDKIILLDWQLLKRTKYFFQSDLKILVKSPKDLRMKKTILRDNITKEAFLLRDKAAYVFDENDFDYIIENDYTNKINKIVEEIYVKSIVSR